MTEQRFYSIASGGPLSYSGPAETRDSHDDHVGNLLSRTDANGTTTYAFDAMNRQTAETRVSTGGDVADSYTVTSSFDLAGNRTEVLCPGTGRTLVSTYDRAERMVQLKDGGKTTTFGYDRAGNRMTEAAANGQVTTSIFDAANRVTSFATVSAAGGPTTPGADVYGVTYGYDLAGQQRRSHEAIAGLATRDLTWAYDGLINKGMKAIEAVDDNTVKNCPALLDSA